MKKYLLLVVALALVLTGVALPALAQDEVTTEAVITGEGSPPRVKAKWELSPNDDPALPGIQIWPNPHPDLTPICVCAVVDDPNGIEDVTAVYADVYHPDGSWKLQVHLERVTDPAEIEELKQAAVASEQITPEEAEELDWEIDKHLAEMWCGWFDYEIHQPAGVYLVSVYAVDQHGGQSSHMENCFMVYSIVVLACDFDYVDYGPILPCKVKWVGGDDNFLPGDGRPTVWNWGNDPAGLWIHSDPMVGLEKRKEIEDFDVELLGLHVDYVASEWVWLPGPLCPCTPTQIDFSVHAPTGSPADTYAGTMTLEIAHSDVPCP